MSSQEKARETLTQAKDRYSTAALDLEAARKARQQAVLDAKAAGLSMTEIAELVGVSRFTAHSIVRYAG